MCDKWATLCLAYGLPSTTSAEEIIARIDKSGEEAERGNQLRSDIIENLGLSPDGCYVLPTGQCISPVHCVHGDPLPITEFFLRLNTKV